MLIVWTRARMLLVHLGLIGCGATVGSRTATIAIAAASSSASAPVVTPAPADPPPNPLRFVEVHGIERVGSELFFEATREMGRGVPYGIFRMPLRGGTPVMLNLVLDRSFSWLLTSQHVFALDEAASCLRRLPLAGGA